MATTILGPTGLEPIDVKVDVYGNVYTLNRMSNNVTKITPEGIITSVGLVGSDVAGFTLDAWGNIYVINYDGYDVVRKLTPQGVLTIVGKLPTKANASGIIIDSKLNIYTSNGGLNNVSKITPEGVSTILGTTGGYPIVITMDLSGNVYTANQDSSDVSKITPQGESTILGKIGQWPRGIAVNTSGDVYTTSVVSSNISKITPLGVSTILATTGPSPQGLTIDSLGNLYTVLGYTTICKVTPLGEIIDLGKSGINPGGISVDSFGNVYTANRGSNTVTKITPDEPATITIPDLRIRIPKGELALSGLRLYLDAGNTSSYPGTGTIWSDLSGNGNNGTLENGPTFDSANGGSIVFDGYDDYVNCGTSNITPLSYSVGCCITLKSLIYQETFVSKSDVINDIYDSTFVLGYTGHNKKFIIGSKLTSGYHVECGSSFIPTINTIYHIYGTYDSSTFTYKLYINGVLVNSQVENFGIIMSPTHRIRVGAAYTNSGNPRKGNIYNVQIYNRVLSSQEILQNFTATTTTQTPSPFNFDVVYACSLPTISVGIVNMIGGVPPYQMGTTIFTSESLALSNTSWKDASSGSYGVSGLADNTFWLGAKDSVGNILTKSVTTNCYGNQPPTPTPTQTPTKTPTPTPTPTVTPTKGGLVQSSLILNLDAGNTISYPGAGTIWSDLSGNGNNGTLVNGTTFDSANGGSIVFDGNDDYVSVNDSSTINGTSQTISLWFKNTGIYNTGYKISEILGKHFAESSYSGYGIVLSNGTGNTLLGCYVKNASVNYVPQFSSKIISPLNWYNVTITFASNSQIILYLNGSFVSSTPIGVLTTSNQPFRIGRSNDSFWNSFKGNVGQTLIYNRVLSSTEILENYNATKEKYATIVQSGLILNLEAGNINSYPRTGTLWRDLSGNNNNGTLVNVPTFDSANGGSIVFDGTNEYVSFSSNISLTNKITVEVWINLNTTTSQNSGWILGREGSYRLIYTSNSFTWVCSTLNNDWYTNGTSVSSASLVTSGMYQVVGTYDGTHNKIYVNGVLINTGVPISGNIKNIGTYNLFKTDASNVDYGKGKLHLHRFYNVALSEQEILQNYNATKGRFNKIVESGPILHLDAGNTISYPGTGTIWTDLSGNGNNGTLVNDPTFDSANGGSIVFDGNDDYVNCGVLNGLGTTNRTINIWFKILSSSPNSTKRIITLATDNTSTDTPAFTVGYGDPSNGIGGGFGGTPYRAYVQDNIPYTLDTWINFCCSINGNTISKYLNGVFIGSATNTGAVGTNPIVYLGRYNDFYQQYGNIKISQTSIYNRVLSSTEVRQNYDDTKGRYGTITSGLLVHLDAGNTNSYPGTGTIWTDLSGNGHNGTFANPQSFDSESGSIVFNGINNRVTFGVVPAALRFTNNFTITVWLKFNSLLNPQTIISCNENAGYGIDTNTVKMISKLWINGSFTPTAGETMSAYNTTSWVNITTTFNGSVINFYRNGNLIQSVSKVGNITYTYFMPLLIGANPTLGPNTVEHFFNGKISQVLIYNKALSSQEVIQNYDATKGRYKIVEQSGLILNLDAGNTNSYPGSGTIWTDLTGNGSNGTLVNLPTFNSGNGGNITFNNLSNQIVSGTTILSPSFTVEFIFMPITMGDYSPQFVVGLGGGAGGWGDFILHTTASGAIYCGTDLLTRITPSDTGCGPGAFLVYNIYHMTFTFSNGIGTLYKNGVLLKSKAMTKPVNGSTPGPYRIQNGGGFQSSMRVYDFRIYNKALTSQEVLQNYKVTTPDCNITANGVEIFPYTATTIYTVLYQSACAEGAITDGIKTGTTITKIGKEGTINTITAIPKKGSTFKGWTKDITLASRSTSYGSPRTLSYNSSIVNDATWYALFTKECSYIDVPFCFNTSKDKLCSACEEQKIVYFDNKDNTYINNGITYNSYWYGSSTLETLITFASVSTTNRVGWSFSTSSQESSGGGTFKEVFVDKYEGDVFKCDRNLSKKIIKLQCRPTNLTTQYFVYLYKNGEKYQRFIETGNSDIEILNIGGNPNNSNAVYKLKCVSDGTEPISFTISTTTEWNKSNDGFCSGGYDYYYSTVYTRSTTPTLMPPDGFYTQIVNGSYSQYSVIYEIYNGLIIDKTYCGSDVLNCDSQYDTSGMFETVTIKGPPRVAYGAEFPAGYTYEKTWTAKNLDVTRYRNGDPIPIVTDPELWANLTIGACCYYNNDISNVKTYGLLYNSYAITDTRGLAPIGWTLPKYDDIRALFYGFGGWETRGEIIDSYSPTIPYLSEKFKTSGTTHWNTPNNGTNETGFSGLPGGYRKQDGSFSDIGTRGWFATTAWYSSPSSFVLFSSDDLKYFYSRSLGAGINGNSYGPVVNRGINLKDGLSIRLIKN